MDKGGPGIPFGNAFVSPCPRRAYTAPSAGLVEKLRVGTAERAPRLTQPASAGVPWYHGAPGSGKGLGRTSVSATAGQAQDQRDLAGRLGIKPGQVVQEIGYDDDCDEQMRDAIA